MIRLTIRISGGLRLSALLAGLLLSLLVFYSGPAPDRPTPVAASAPAAFLPRTSGRHFYVTDSSYLPSAVLGACSSGYHMASLWEILDVSNLTYDTTHPNAHNQDDSGYGPPSSYNGWVRTGYNASVAEFTGTGNCQNWTSDAAAHYGANVRLSRFWETDPGDMLAWDASSFACNYPWPVWCVGDFSVVYLPLVMKR